MRVDTELVRRDAKVLGCGNDRSEFTSNLGNGIRRAIIQIFRTQAGNLLGLVVTLDGATAGETGPFVEPSKLEQPGLALVPIRTVNVIGLTRTRVNTNELGTVTYDGIVGVLAIYAGFTLSKLVEPANGC